MCQNYNFSANGFIYGISDRVSLTHIISNIHFYLLCEFRKMWPIFTLSLCATDEVGENEWMNEFPHIILQLCCYAHMWTCAKGIITSSYFPVPSARTMIPPAWQWHQSPGRGRTEACRPTFRPSGALGIPLLPDSFCQPHLEPQRLLLQLHFQLGHHLPAPHPWWQELRWHPTGLCPLFI